MAWKRLWLPALIGNTLTVRSPGRILLCKTRMLTLIYDSLLYILAVLSSKPCPEYVFMFFFRLMSGLNVMVLFLDSVFILIPLSFLSCLAVLLRLVCPYLFLPPSILILFILSLFLLLCLCSLLLGLLWEQESGHQDPVGLTIFFCVSWHPYFHHVYTALPFLYSIRALSIMTCTFPYICRLRNPPYSSHFLFNRNFYIL